MAHHKIKVVFRTTKSGEWKGALDCVYADVRREGFTEVTSGGTYQNDWYVTMTRPATEPEYRAELKAMNKHGAITFGGDDTYEYIPTNRRSF